MNDFKYTNKSTESMRRSLIKTTFWSGIASLIIPLSNIKLFAGEQKSKSNLNLDNNIVKKINVKIHPLAIKRNNKG